MSLINFPILYIPDPGKGRPLFNGQIYVGQPDLDPTVLANQKQLNVIQEDGTVVPVAQPFVLSAGGVPVYNGKHVRLDVTGNYSIKILSKLSVQVYYIENVFEGQPVTELDLINDLSQAYVFDTVADMTASTIVFPINKKITTKVHNATSGEGGASYLVTAGLTTEPVGSPDLIGGGYAKLKAESPYLLSIFGAIDGQDSTAAIQGAIDEKGSIDVDGDYLFSSSLAVNREKFTVIGSGSLAGVNKNSAITYSDLVKNLILKDFTLKTCAGTQTINSLTSSIDFVRVTNITIDDTEIGIHLLGAVKNAVFRDNTFNNLHRTLLDQSCQGIKIGNNDRATSLETKKISIVDNHFTDIVNDFNKETHAFIVYGREVVATGNIAEGVTHAAAVACETYYFKADIVTCTGNTVLNQGVANDGCINFKGGPAGDTAQVTGQRITCTGNTIVNEDLSLSIIGISCTDENATITGNTLHNTWLRAFSGNDMLIASNTVYMERSTGSITWIEIENCNRVTVKDNKIHVIANNFDVNTAQAARVRASASNMDDIKIINNEIIVEYPDLTTGSNTVASLQLWAENFDITNVRVEGNNLTLVTPLIGAVADRQFIAFSGTNSISGKIVRNVTNVDLLYFDDNSYAGRTLEFVDNIVNDVILVASNKGFEEKATDVRVRNEGATGIRTANLPLARAGITMDFFCSSPTYTMPVVRAGADTFTDAATTKTLSVGASMKLRCFTTGTWHIESDAGVIT